MMIMEIKKMMGIVKKKLILNLIKSQN